jgi:flagellar basal body-associated protein FliL
MKKPPQEKKGKMNEKEYKIILFAVLLSIAAAVVALGIIFSVKAIKNREAKKAEAEKTNIAAIYDAPNYLNDFIYS